MWDDRGRRRVARAECGKAAIAPDRSDGDDAGGGGATIIMYRPRERGSCTGSSDR